jgi:uncharacterized protein (TIGR03437 family)
LKQILQSCALMAIVMAAGVVGVHAQNVVVDQTTLTFSAQFNGSVVSQPLNLTSSSSTQMPFSVFSNANWIKVNDQSATNGSTPATITVKVDPAGFNPGTYQASLTVFGGPTGFSVPVTLTVSTLGVTPSAIAFPSYIAGSNIVPSPQSVAVSGATNFTAAPSTDSGGNWLQASAASGAVTAVLNPAVLPGLPVGTYKGKITITPTGSSNNIPVEVQVTLTVVGAPVISVSPDSFQFNVQTGGTNNQTSQVLTISAQPATKVNFAFTPTSDPALANRITISPSSVGATNAQTGQAQVTVTLDQTGLQPNTYDGGLFLTTNISLSAVQIPFTVVVSSTALLNIPAAPLSFTYNVGGANPSPQNVNVTATSGTLAYTLATSANTPWLSVPSTGSTSAPFAVSMNPAGLAPGIYNGSVTVTGNTGGSGVQTIPVTFKVTSDPTFLPGFTSLSFPYQNGQAIPASVQLKIASSTGAPLNFTATPGETTCVASNWLILNGTAGTAVTGSTDAALVVSVNPSGLAAGSCTGSITFTGTVASTGAAVTTVSVPVTLYVSNTALLMLTPPSLNFNVAVGATMPSTKDLTLSSSSPTDQLTYAVSVPTPGSGNWLFVGQQSGTTPGTAIPVFVIPGQLAAGTYSGSVVISAVGPGGAAVANSPITVPVTLTVGAGTLFLSTSTVAYNYTLGGSAPPSQTVNISSTGSALNYTAVATSTGNWISVSPSSGNTGSNSLLTINADGSKLTAAGTYSGVITVTAVGAANSPQTINVTVTVVAGGIAAPGTTLTFNQVVGGAAPAAQTIAVTGSPGSLNFTVATSSPATWLSVTPVSGATPGSVQVQVDGAGLVAGRYTNGVVIASAGATGTPITVPVVLNVTAAQTLSANPASLAFNYTIGQSAPIPQKLAIGATGSGVTIVAQVQYSGASMGSWLQVLPASGATPATLTVTADPGNLPAGSYNARIEIASSSAVGIFSVPVTFTVVEIPRPVVTAVANAANYSTGGISPGENIVIFGRGIGPAVIAGLTVSNGLVDTMAGSTRVLFDGVAGAMIYASSTQTSVMVPYGISGRSTTSVVVEFGGVASSPIAYNVVPSAPGIYTLNQQGTGAGAILNENGFTVNGPNTPAPRGSVVSVYMTGEGQTAPGGADGAVIPPVLSALKNPLLKVTATVGGLPADVQYAGSAAGLVSGLMQVNLTIPANAPVGAQVPILITVGSATSQPGVTIAVQ